MTVSDYERYISHDLTAAIDARYRTIPRRDARGLAGHSMGGYGTTQIGMKHADMYGAIYMMSPCCLSPTMMARPEATDEKALTGLASPRDSEKLNWGQRAMLAASAAWSPDPKNPPRYLDLPVMEGKAALFKRFADIDAFPICLDAHDADEIVRIVKALAPGFAGINLEDISAGALPTRRAAAGVR